MNITFDPAKDAANIAKHGVSLAMAATLDWDTAWVRPDERADYGEPRQIGYAAMAGRLYCVVFVERNDVRRIISLRKANTREIDRYEDEIDPTNR